MILEDEPLARKILRNYISRIPEITIEVEVSKPERALDYLEDNEVDLLFLDINLPEMSGVDFYKSLVEKPAVIFTTAHGDYAVEGFELDAIDFLLKPFSFERFQKAIEKYLSQQQVKSEPVLIVRQDKKIHRVNFDQIVHIESMGDFAKIRTLDKTYISSDTLKNLMKLLPESKFLRVHKSHIISIEAIEYMEGNMLIFGDKKIPVGASYRDQISKYFSN